MNDIVVPWCRAQKIEVTRSRAYKKNDQAFVEQKNGAVVRRLMGYGRFDGIETAQVMARLYAAARLHVNFFQPSFKLKEKRREGAKVIKRYHAPATPYERALATSQAAECHQATAARDSIARSIRWCCSPKSALPRRTRSSASTGGGLLRRQMPLPDPTRSPSRGRSAFNASLASPRGTHRRAKRKYKTRIRMPSKLDPHLATIEDWLAAEPQLTALAIVRRLAAQSIRIHFGTKQHSIVQRLLKALRQQGGESAHRRDRSRRGRGRNARRGCWQHCGRAAPSVE